MERRLGDTRYGIHRVLEPTGVLPQAAERLDVTPSLWPDETRVLVECLNLDAACFRQLFDGNGGDCVRIRLEVLNTILRRGKMHNRVTGSGGMLIGVVDEIGPDANHGLSVGDRIASLVSLTLTPLSIADGLARWDGLSPQVPTSGHAILFSSTSLTILPDDLAASLVLSVLDVCGAPALTSRVVSDYVRRGLRPRVAVIGASGKSGSLAAAAAARAGAERVVGIVPNDREAKMLKELPLLDDIVVADARRPMAVVEALGEQVDVSVVCVDVAGCEHASILATACGGTVIFFSMATSFQSAALGAEGVGADVTMLIGNGFVPGHAEEALAMVRAEPALRALIERRLEP